MNKSTLSSEGLRRRDIMLDQIKLDWRAKRRRKIQILTGTTVTSLLAVAILLNYGLSDSPPEEGTLVAKSNTIAVQPNAVDTSRSGFTPERKYRLDFDKIVVKTDPQIADRYLVKTADIDISRVDVISDEELQSALAEFGSEFGVATIAGKMKAIPIRN